MWVTWVILNLLLAVFGVSDEVIPAVELMADHWELGVHVGLETAPHPAALGRQVQLCIARERVKLALSCTTAGVTKRRAYTPAKGASVHRVPGDGGCGWTAMHGGLQHCL
ncbi:unnamed protein product, partial [Pylaiella littoralis]